MKFARDTGTRFSNSTRLRIFQVVNEIYPPPPKKKISNVKPVFRESVKITINNIGPVSFLKRSRLNIYFYNIKRFKGLAALANTLHQYFLKFLEVHGTPNNDMRNPMKIIFKKESTQNMAINGIIITIH